MSILDLKNIISAFGDTCEELGQMEMTIFSEICRKNGITIFDIQQKLHLLPGTVVQHVKALSKYFSKDQNGKRIIKGLDLIRIEPNSDRSSRYQVFLTEKGEKVKLVLSQ